MKFIVTSSYTHTHTHTHTHNFFNDISYVDIFNIFFFKFLQLVLYYKKDSVMVLKKISLWTLRYKILITIFYVILQHLTTNYIVVVAVVAVVVIVVVVIVVVVIVVVVMQVG